MSADSAAHAVLSYYSLSPPLVRHIEPLGNAGGWSGSQLWRVQLVDGRNLCLRRWPETQRPRRLRLIQSVLQRVYSHGLTVVPVPMQSQMGDTLVQYDKQFWEVAPWMPGTADYHHNPSRQRLRAALQTLALFHNLSAVDVSVVCPHAVIQRLDQLEACQLHNFIPYLREKLQQNIFDERLHTLSIQVLQRITPRIDSLILTITRAREIRVPVQPAIRDIHHDHMLFVGDEVSGVIDFGAMRIDTPLTDIARLVGSLVGDDAASRAFAMNAYAEIRPLSAKDRQLIDLLDESGVVLAGLNWLTWLYVDRRDMGPIAPIIRRLDEILRRLERMI